MTLNFNTSTPNQYIKNQPQSGDNFSGLPQDTQKQLGNVGTTITTTAQESWLASILKGFQTKEFQKAVISITGSAAVILGLSGLFNHGIRKDAIFKIGEYIDNLVNKFSTTEFAKNSNKWVNEYLTPIKKTIESSRLNQKITEQKNWFKALKDNHINFWATHPFAKPILNGTSGEALDTITDALKAMDVDDKIKKIIDSALIAKHHPGKGGFFNHLAEEEMQKISIESKEILEELKKLNGGNGANITIDQVKKLLTSKKIDIQYAESLSGLCKDMGKLKSMLSNLTGLDANSTEIAVLVKKIQHIKVEDESKFDTFKEIYELITKDFKKGDKIDTKKLNEFFNTFNGTTQQTDASGMGFFAAQKVNLGDALKKYAILQGHGAETKLGAKTQEILLRSVEGITNGVTSRAAMGLVMGLSIYYGVMNKTQEVPKDKKVATLADSAVTDAGSYMLFPVAGTLLYNAANLKYVGSKPEQIKAYKEGLTIIAAELAEKLKDIPKGFNKDSLKGKKEAYAWAKSEYKALLNAVNENVRWYHKPLRWISSFLSIGMEKIPTDGLLKTKAKGFFGAAIRVILVMMVIAPILLKPILGICHKIFGKPPEEESDKKKDDLTTSKIANNNVSQVKGFKISGNYIDILAPKSESKSNGTQVSQNYLNILNPTAQPAGQSHKIAEAISTVAAMPIAATQVSQPVPQVEKKPEIETQTEQKTDAKPDVDAAAQLNNDSSLKRSYVPSSEPSEFKDEPKENEVSPEVEKLLKNAEKLEKHLDKGLE